jgi:hypothetical protein
MKRRRSCSLGTGKLWLSGFFFVAFWGTWGEDLHIYLDGWDGMGWDGMGFHGGNWRPSDTA